MASETERDTGDRRVTLRLTPRAVEAIDQIIELGGFKTKAEAVRRALGDELFLLKEQKEGWKVTLKKGNRYREVRWTGP